MMPWKMQQGLVLRFGELLYKNVVDGCDVRSIGKLCLLDDGKTWIIDVRGEHVNKSLMVR